MNIVEILSQKPLAPNVQVVEFFIKGSDQRDPTFRGKALVGNKGICVLEGWYGNYDGGKYPFSRESVVFAEEELEKHFKVDSSF